MHSPAQIHTVADFDLIQERISSLFHDSLMEPSFWDLLFVYTYIESTDTEGYGKEHTQNKHPWFVLNSLYNPWWKTLKHR